MIDVSGPALRRVAGMLGFPEGAGELINQPTRRRLLASLLGSVVLSGLDMLGVVAMLPLLQFVAGQSRESGALGVLNRALDRPGDSVLIGAVAGLVVVCFVGKDLFALVFRRWQIRFMAQQEVGLSVKMMSHYLNGPYAWQLERNTGDKVWTINSAVSMGFSGGLSAALGAITEILTVTLILVSLTFVSPWTTVAAVAYFGVAALIIQRFVRPRVLEASLRSQEAGLRISQVTLQALGSGKEVKLRNAAGLFVDDFRRARVEGAEAGARAGFLSEIPKYVMEILFVVGIGLLAVGVASQGSKAESLILLGVFAAAGSRVMPSAVRLLGALNSMRFSREPLRHVIRIRRMLDMARRHEESRVVTDQCPQGDVDVRGVCFTYPLRPDQQVLREVSVTIPQGKSVALVGSSGAGKSTLVDLLLGLLHPDSGTITAGGINIHDNLPAWQRQLSVVPQDVVLFDDSLKANIAFELPFDELKMKDVVRRAQLEDLVAEMPAGLDSTVGERGTRLSGGQRQRIGVARALYRQPQVLFLDEATSALDNETERRLTDTISDLKGSMTIVIVAHRLSTVRDCDQVIFMSEGMVATVGTFAEVAANNAEFAHLVRLGSLTGHMPRRMAVTDSPIHS